MKRKYFLILSGIVAWIFSLGMIFMPAGFTSGISAQAPTAAVNAWATFLGSNLFAIGFINLFSSFSPWSSAVRAILWGNIVLHVLAIATDANAYNNNVINMGGLMQGTIVHVVFIIGFSYYAFRKSTRDAASTSKASSSKATT